MYRHFEEKLHNWNVYSSQIPLMVIGPRQVGKTYTIDAFCRNKFRDYIYCNFFDQPELKEIFALPIAFKKKIELLEVEIGRAIDPSSTVLFLDEIQESEQAIADLKAFNEAAEPYRVICAGSLLGVKLNRMGSSFPVGKVKIEKLYPMNFEEFLLALDQSILIGIIREAYQNNIPLAQVIHTKAIDFYLRYLCVGGMPEAVKSFVASRDSIMKFDMSIAEDIIFGYKADMKKHVRNTAETLKIRQIFDSIPQQLKSPSRRFVFSKVARNAQKKRYENAFEWLKSSGIISVNTRVSQPRIPLSVYEESDYVKLYYGDVGLLRFAAGIDIRSIVVDAPFEYKGILAENYVASELRSVKLPLFYWQSNNKAEVDFLITLDSDVVPVEVKASVNVRSKSLGVYREKYNPPLSVRISARNFGYENGIKSVPLYAVFCLSDEIKQRQEEEVELL